MPWELPKWVQCKTEPAHSGCFKELLINEVLWMASLSKPTLKARLNVLEHQSSFGNLKLGIHPCHTCAHHHRATHCPTFRFQTVSSCRALPASQLHSQSLCTLAKDPAPLICLSIASRWGYTSLIWEKMSFQCQAVQRRVH